MHPHKQKSKNRAHRRLARQAWKNLAALNSYQIVFDANYFELIRIKNNVVQVSAKLHVSMRPAKVISNPAIILWYVNFPFKQSHT